MKHVDQFVHGSEGGSCVCVDLVRPFDERAEKARGGRIESSW